MNQHMLKLEFIFIYFVKGRSSIRCLLISFFEKFCHSTQYDRISTKFLTRAYFSSAEEDSSRTAQNIAYSSGSSSCRTISRVSGLRDVLNV